MALEASIESVRRAEVLIDAVEKGAAVLLISEDLDEVLKLSDRIVVMKDRVKIGEVSNGPGLSVDTIVEMIAAPTEEEDLPPPGELALG